MKKLNLLKITFFATFGMLIFGCDIINPDEKIPSYLEITSMTVTDLPNVNEGSLSSNISHVNVFVDNPQSGQNEALGIVELPATIPILLSGEFQINVEPVIKSNGSVFSLNSYPYYETVTFIRTLTEGEVTSVSLETTYKQDLSFDFIEDFEFGVTYFTRNVESASPNEIKVFEDGAFEGKSGKIELDTTNAGFIITTQNPVPLDLTKTGLIYMELNYKTDIPIEFGVIGVDGVGGENPIWEFIILEKAEWNKIYLNMTELVQIIGDDQFRFGVRGIMPYDPAVGEFETDRAEVLLDNIKLVHF